MQHPRNAMCCFPSSVASLPVQAQSAVAVVTQHPSPTPTAVVLLHPHPESLLQRTATNAARFGHMSYWLSAFLNSGEIALPPEKSSFGAPLKTVPSPSVWKFGRCSVCSCP